MGWNHDVPTILDLTLQANTRYANSGLQGRIPISYSLSLSCAIWRLCDVWWDKRPWDYNHVNWSMKALKSNKHLLDGWRNSMRNTMQKFGLKYPNKNFWNSMFKMVGSRYASSWMYLYQMWLFHMWTTARRCGGWGYLCKCWYMVGFQASCYCCWCFGDVAGNQWSLSQSETRRNRIWIDEHPDTWNTSSGSLQMWFDLC